MEALLDQAANGLTAGAEYALIAAGLSLIFGVLEIVNFAHGEFYMLGAYFLYFGESRLHLPYLPAAALAVAGMAIVGALFFELVLRRILDRGWQIQLVATLAVSITLINLVILLTDPTPKLVESPLSAVILAIGPAHVSLQRVLVLLLTVLAFAGLYAFLRFARNGKAMRAVAQNREAAAVVGIPIARIGLAAAVAAAMLAGTAAVAIAPLYNVQPTMGVPVIVKAFAAIILGGFGNVTGAVVSAFALGMVEAFSVHLVSSDYADVVVFGLMLIVLLVRPRGLFGRAVRQ